MWDRVAGEGGVTFHSFRSLFIIFFSVPNRPVFTRGTEKLCSPVHEHGKQDANLVGDKFLVLNKNAKNLIAVDAHTTPVQNH